MGKSVDEIVLNLPKEEQVIVKKLRSLVLECLPKATEKISYGAPFYSRNRMICFLWPPSLYWSPQQKPGKHQHKGVSLGFCYGNLMSNDQGVLLSEGRKQVFSMYFKSLSEIDEALIRSLLFEAEMIDEGFAKRKKPKLGTR
jgi:hypothetical protein